MGASRRAPLLVTMLCAVLLAACTNSPPPPVVTTPPAPTTTPAAENPSQIVIGIDAIAGGYNPHNLADSSSVTSALSQLLLPSVFRADDDGTPRLDKNLMVSADVVSQEPFTVAYEIRPEASWSDGAPIAVEDFIYLWEAMRDEPGTVQPAGYRMISGIQPGAGGKRVEVSFAQPYPGWQSLFSDLLPAHLYKDAPGGWASALEGSFPAYGGPFSIKTTDADRGEIILERNERYWGKPAAVDRLVFRRADPAGLASALRSGNDQLALSATDAAGQKLMTDLGAGHDVHSLARPEVASVVLRPSGGTLSDERVRAGVAALLDRDKLIDEGTDGGPSAALRADAQVLAPSMPGYTPTMPQGAPPAVADPAKAGELLSSAGYTKESGTWRKEGRPLTLVLAAPGDQQPYGRIADELTTQLEAAGVAVTTVNPAPRELYRGALAEPSSGDPAAPPEPDDDGTVGVDVAVIPQSVGGDPAAILAGAYGCRPRPSGDSVRGQQTTTSQPATPSSRQPSSTSGSRPPSTAEQPEFCSPELTTVVEDALSGRKPMPEALAAVEPELWNRNVVLPLFQLADTMVIGPGALGITPGPPLMGPFGSAVNWTRASR